MSNYLDQLLLDDSSGRYQSAWEKLKARLLREASVDENPVRHIYFHMDHGPDHWNRVRDAISVLWHAASLANPDWGNSRNAFILSASAYLHDISMVVGWDGVPTDQLSIGPHMDEHFKNFGQFNLNGGLLRQHGNTSIGRFVIRKRQAAIAAAWTNERQDELFPGIKSEVRNIIINIVEYYHRAAAQLYPLAENLTTAEPKLFLSMVAVLQFGDWAHLDHTRVRKAFADHVESDLHKAVTNTSNQLNALIEPFGALPKWYRSHYVQEPRIALNCQAGQKPRVVFELSLASPPGFGKNLNKNLALSRLVQEWQTKFFPKLTLPENLGDSLREYAGIELDFRFPTMASKKPKRKLRRVHPFVRDFWVASHWFDLSMGSQFYASPWRRKSPDEEVALAPEPQYMYSRLGVKQRFNPAIKPILPRRAFLYFHAALTKGQAFLATLFFRQLACEVSSISHRAQLSEVNPLGRLQSWNAYFKQAFQILEPMLKIEAKRYSRWWPDDVEGSKEQYALGMLSHNLWPGHLSITQYKNLCKKEMIPEEAIRSALDFAVEKELVQIVDDKIEVHP